MRALSKIAVTSAVLATVLGAGIGSAIADPPTQPATTDIVGVGSDTTTPILTTIAANYDATGPTAKLYSWDATGSANIQTKGTASADPLCDIVRPNGSGAGIKALSTPGLTTHDGHPCIDFARSSRATASTDPKGFDFVAFARDAITWSANSNGHVPAGASLTLAQLAQIYSCNNTATTDGGWKWSDFFTGASSDEIVPVLPQNGSGTRAQFISDLFGTAGLPATAVNCVVNENGNQVIEENEGTNAIFSGAQAADIVYPYSIGAFISQVDTKTATGQQPGNLLPQDLTNGTTKVAPITGTGSSAVISTGLPSLAYRLLYNVVPNSGTGTAIPANLVPIFGTATQGGFICKSESSVIKSFGFLTLSNCGALTPSL